MERSGLRERHYRQPRISLRLKRLASREPVRPLYFLVVQFLLNFIHHFGRDHTAGRRQHPPTVPQFRLARGSVPSGATLFAEQVVLF